MHYKNGREIKVGDMAIGVTHNSEHSLRIGRVVRLMPEQGPCNVELVVMVSLGTLIAGAETLTTIREIGGQKHSVLMATDYADAIKLFRIDDCVKMANAVCDHGLHNSQYSKEGPIQ